MVRDDLRAGYHQTGEYNESDSSQCRSQCVLCAEDCKINISIEDGALFRWKCQQEFLKLDADYEFPPAL